MFGRLHKRLFVVDKKDSLVAGGGLAIVNCVGSLFLSNLREADGEGGTLTRFARHHNVAVGLIHNALDYGKAETRAFARLFRGKEWIEYLVEDFGRHTDTRVANHKPHVETGLHAVRAAPGRRAEIGEIDVENPSLLPHRVGGVCTEVHKDLLNLGGVAEDRCGFTCNIDPHADSRRCGCPQELHGLRDYGAQSQRFLFLLVLPGVGEHLSDQFPPPEARFQDPLQVMSLRAPFGDIVGRQLCETYDCREHVVKIVGYAARERAEGVHLLCLAELLLQFFTLFFEMKPLHSLADERLDRFNKLDYLLWHLRLFAISQMDCPKDFAAVGNGDDDDARIPHRNARAPEPPLCLVRKAGDEFLGIIAMEAAFFGHIGHILAVGSFCDHPDAHALIAMNREKILRPPKILGKAHVGLVGDVSLPGKHTNPERLTPRPFLEQLDDFIEILLLRGLHRIELEQPIGPTYVRGPFADPLLQVFACTAHFFFCPLAIGDVTDHAQEHALAADRRSPGADLNGKRCAVFSTMFRLKENA